MLGLIVGKVVSVEKREFTKKDGTVADFMNVKILQGENTPDVDVVQFPIWRNQTTQQYPDYAKNIKIDSQVQIPCRFGVRNNAINVVGLS